MAGLDIVRNTIGRHKASTSASVWSVVCDNEMTVGFDLYFGMDTQSRSCKCYVFVTRAVLTTRYEHSGVVVYSDFFLM